MKHPERYARPKRPRTPDGSHSGSTKFDKWLRAKKIAKEGIIVVLKFALYPSSDDELNSLPEFHFNAQVIEVDRYCVALEFTDFITENDGATWWIQKDQIRATSVGFSS